MLSLSLHFAFVSLYYEEIIQGLIHTEQASTWVQNHLYNRILGNHYAKHTCMMKSSDKN